MALAAARPVSAPRRFLLRMAAFLALVGGVVLVLHREIASAFLANPGLDALIVAVVALGIVTSMRRVTRLDLEVDYANAALAGAPGTAARPRLLAPLAACLGERPFAAPVAAYSLRQALDAAAGRLDEDRELARYLVGLPILLGLLGTFWGLVVTVATFGDVVAALDTDAALAFAALKTKLAAPIAGVSLAFGSSLFGLAGTLVAGFAELQAGMAEERFLAELDHATMVAVESAAGPLPGLDALPPDLRATLEKIAATADHSHARATMVAVADLADGVQKLVGQMRSEQQLIREWVETQSEQGREMRAALNRLTEQAEAPAE